MNFFGHAVVASWSNRRPEFALGAMLPDLVHMVGRHRIQSDAQWLGAGIDFHHQTDAVFHDSPTFVKLQRRAWAELAASPLRRGARLAVAHVGLELILDAELSRAEHHRQHYANALQALTSAELRERLQFPDATDDPWSDLEALLATLMARQMHLAPRTPEQLFDRLRRVLSARPSLALTADDAPWVASWGREAYVEVHKHVQSWTTEIREGLRLPSERTPANVLPSLAPESS